MIEMFRKPPELFKLLRQQHCVVLEQKKIHADWLPSIGTSMGSCWQKMIHAQKR